MAPMTFTDEQDGVIATRPATMPDAAPSDVALPSRMRSTSSQASIAVGGGDVRVDEGRRRRCRRTATAEPALNPNQPNHSRAAPSITNGRLCGRIGVVGQPFACRG